MTLDQTVQSLAAFPDDTIRALRAVLTDIDDTLTLDGRLPAVAYDALERLRSAGMIVVPVTGRPAGWCDLIARQWPVDAVVGENGAFWFRYDGVARRMFRSYQRSETERLEDRCRLDRVAAEVLATVPGSAIASDQGFRSADLAIDFCEDVAPLPPGAVGRIVDIFERHGATAKVSSIHVNGWFGTYDKLRCSLELLRDVFGIDGTDQRDTVVFVGDSPNDSPMFRHFPNAVGVANVKQYAGSIDALPAYVTEAPRAEGFAELANHILAARA